PPARADHRVCDPWVRSLLVIQRLESFEPHSRDDLDYTAEAGSYEPQGCKEHGLRGVRAILVGHSDGVREAIAEQRAAEEGNRQWAFDDPQRVAVESLKAFYESLVHLKLVKKRPGRQVFRWRNGTKSVVVVVTRPYWLSFYAKSPSVAWVATL